MAKKNEKIISECRNFRIKCASESGFIGHWAFSDEVNHIIYFNRNGTIIYQEGSEGENNKTQTVIKVEQIDRVAFEKPTLFKNGKIVIYLKNGDNYSVEFPNKREYSIKLLQSWLKNNLKNN